jgi:uncharacterized protein YecT (DUF1311 family)
MSFLLALAFAALSAQGAIADEPSWREPPACWDGPQSELNHCARTEYRSADEAMNIQWKKTSAVLKRLDGNGPDDSEAASHFEALLSGQRAWLLFRDEHCKIYRAMGGSIAPMLEGLCLRDLTLERTEQLKMLSLNPATGSPYYEDL